MRYAYRNVVRSNNGLVIPGASINIYLAGTSTPANVYASEIGGGHITSTTTDSAGAFSFYVDDSDYGPYQKFKVEIFALGITRSLDNLIIFDTEKAIKISNAQYYGGLVAASIGIDWNNGNVQRIVLANGANTITMANAKSGGRYVLILKQPASGAAGTVTWPAAVVWPSGITPVLSSVNGKRDLFSLIYDGTDSEYYGNSSLNY